MNYDDFIQSLGNRLDKFSFDSIINPIYADIAKRLAKVLQIEDEAEQKQQLKREKKLLKAFIFGMEYTNDILDLTQQLAVETVEFTHAESAQAYEQLNKPIPPAPVQLAPKAVEQAAERIDHFTPREATYTPSSALRAVNSDGIDRSIPDWFQKELDKAIARVRSGEIDYNKALKETVQTMVNGGIVFVEYQDGKKVRRTVESVIRLNIITALTELAGNTTLYDIIDLKPPYVDVSRHVGARTDGSQTIVDHMFWQGKRYSLSDEFWKKYGDGKQGTKGKAEHPDFLKVTGYKQAGGLHSFNCRHSFKAAWDFTKPTYTAEELEEANTKELEQTQYEWVDSIGRRHKRGFTLRQAMDRQRLIERDMRKSLSIGRAMKEANNMQGFEEARSLYYTQLKEYKRFSSAMGIMPQLERVYTAYPNGFKGMRW